MSPSLFCMARHHRRQGTPLATLSLSIYILYISLSLSLFILRPCHPWSATLVPLPPSFPFPLASPLSSLSSPFSLFLMILFLACLHAGVGAGVCACLFACVRVGVGACELACLRACVFECLCVCVLPRCGNLRQPQGVGSHGLTIWAPKGNPGQTQSPCKAGTHSLVWHPPKEWIFLSEVSA